MIKKRLRPKKNPSDSQKLETIISLLNHLLAIQLYKSGATMDQICKHLHVAKKSVVEMLKGIKRE